MNKCSYTRFKSDKLDYALIDLNAKGKSFNPDVVALLINESFTGCAVLITHDDYLKNGAKVKVKVGHIDPIPAQIVWVKILEENIQKIGLRYLD